MASSGSLEKRSEEEDTGLDDVEELESEVNEMARKIMEYRSSLPELLKAGFASLLEARIPVVALPDKETGASDKDGALRNLEAEIDQETSEKIRLLKQKISSNAAAMPVVLKRMNECIARIEKLDSCKFTVNPVFKRKRNN
uniref:Uncharacterized protein n=1 Tax=Kalanchoe fedtschenkoi TaxID=63787 RepID=A0A7N1A8A3_KALFE